MTGTEATSQDADRDENPPTRDTGARRTEGGGRGRHRGLYWLLPVLALLGGLLLGGSVVGAAGLGTGGESAASDAEPSDAPTPEPSSTSGDRTVTIPGSCVEGLDRAESAIQAARNGVDAVGNLDREGLRRALDRLLTLQPEITDLAATCRSAATSGG